MYYYYFATHNKYQEAIEMIVITSEQFTIVPYSRYTDQSQLFNQYLQRYLIRKQNLTQTSQKFSTQKCSNERGTAVQAHQYTIHALNIDAAASWCKVAFLLTYVVVWDTVAI
jgi:hypothetical protein